MKLLLTNDDGVFAPGLHALAMELKKEFEIAIVAPDSQRSCAGLSFTCSHPLMARRVELDGLAGVPTFAVSGTPVDCVKLGCFNLGLAMDMVVSGINHGSNLGTDVLYSGTVGAALEAALLGFPAIAVSNYSLTPSIFSAGAQAARWAVRYLMEYPLPAGTLLNINTPDLPPAQIRGVRRAPLCVQEYGKLYERLPDQDGALCFAVPRGNHTCFGPDDDLDERWVREGYTVFSPLRFDFPDQNSFHNVDLSGFSWE